MFLFFFLLQTQPPLYYISMETHPEVSQSPMVFFVFFYAGNIFKYQRRGGRGRIRVREGGVVMGPIEEGGGFFFLLLSAVEIAACSLSSC